MQEVELKLQVPPAAGRAVDAAVAGRSAPRRLHLRAAYADTADAMLAQARMALRVRREGRRWVQTLKGAGEHALERFEHNVALAGPSSAVPAFDAGLHRGTPVGDRLISMLERSNAVLGVRYETDVFRRTRVQRAGTAKIELAFDTGAIRSTELEWPLCELELELLSGSPHVLLDQAQRWIERHGLWIDTRSKAERGELLANGTRIAPSRTARATALARETSVRDAWRTVVRECAEQIGANASQIASGDFGDEHVHQLRVGLRRLRSATQLFATGEAAAASAIARAEFTEPAAALFRALGAARDRAVVESGFTLELRRALEAVGATELAEPAPSREALEADARAVCEHVRSAATQSLLLTLLAESLGDSALADALHEPAEPFARLAATRLKRWHERAARDAKRYAELDDLQRHRLRKRIKRLRYAIEFCGDLFDRKAVKRYLKPLRELQERLGAINDVTVAMDALSLTGVEPAQGRETHSAAHRNESRRWFALGWLSARRDALVADAAPTLKAFAKADAFWRLR